MLTSLNVLKKKKSWSPSQHTSCECSIVLWELKVWIRKLHSKLLKEFFLWVSGIEPLQVIKTVVYTF